MNCRIVVAGFASCAICNFLMAGCCSVKSFSLTPRGTMLPTGPALDVKMEFEFYECLSKEEQALLIQARTALLSAATDLREGKITHEQYKLFVSTISRSIDGLVEVKKQEIEDSAAYRASDWADAIATIRDAIDARPW